MIEGAARGPDDELRPLTAKEVATILNCNVKSVYEAMKRGELPVITIGRLRFIPGPAFRRLLKDGGKAA